MAQKKSLQKKYVQKTTIKKQRLPPYCSIKSLSSLPENLCLLHNAYEAGTKTFSTNLVPPYDAPMEMHISSLVQALTIGDTYHRTYDCIKYHAKIVSDLN